MAQKNGSNGARGIPSVLWYAVAALVLMGGTIVLVRQVPGLRELVVKASESGVEIQLKQEAEIHAALDLVAGDKDRLPALQSWLRANLARVDPNGIGFLEFLISQCPAVPDGPLVEYQAKLEKCDDSPMVGRLRRLSEDREAPFQRRAVRVRIATPRDSEPQSGLAYTCFGGELENKRVRLILPDQSRRLEVQVRGGYECDPGNTYPDLQVNGAEVSSLLGRSTNEIESVFALIV